MSRGPGRIERALRTLFDSAPAGRAFFTDELIEHCFPEIDEIERTHTVSVLRAARKIVAGDPDWRSNRQAASQQMVFYNHGNLTSCALMWIVSWASHDWTTSQLLYDPDGDCVIWQRPGPGLAPSYGHIWARAEEMLALPEYQKNVTPPDGRWWRQWRQHCAERDGDTETATALKAQQEAELAALAGGLHDLLQPPDPREALRKAFAELAGRARALMATNDPDAIRQGLGDIAGRLESVFGLPSSE
jgi:hypothetical protein